MTQSGERLADNLGASGQATWVGTLGFGEQKEGHKYCWYKKQPSCYLR